jgi:hypothetical protein
MAVAFMGDNSSWLSKYCSTSAFSAWSVLRVAGEVLQATSTAVASRTGVFFMRRW